MSTPEGIMLTPEGEVALKFIAQYVIFPVFLLILIESLLVALNIVTLTGRITKWNVLNVRK